MAESETSGEAPRIRHTLEELEMMKLSEMTFVDKKELIAHKLKQFPILSGMLKRDVLRLQTFEALPTIVLPELDNLPPKERVEKLNENFVSYLEKERERLEGIGVVNVLQHRLKPTGNKQRKQEMRSFDYYKGRIKLLGPGLVYYLQSEIPQKFIKRKNNTTDYPKATIYFELEGEEPILVEDNRTRKILPWEQPDLEAEELAFQKRSTSQFLEQYLAEIQILQLLETRKDDDVSDVEKAVLNLCAYYLEVDKEQKIKKLWSTLYLLLKDGGIQQTAIHPIDFVLYFFIFYSYLVDRKTETTVNPKDVAGSSKIIFSAEELSKNLTQNHFDLIAGLQFSTLESIIFGCTELLSIVEYRSEILLHMASCLVKIVEKRLSSIVSALLLSQVDLNRSLLVIVFNLIDMNKYMQEEKSKLKQPQILQTFEDTVKVAVRHVLSHINSLAQHFTQQQSKTLMIEDNNRYRRTFLKDHKGILFEFCRQLERRLGEDPHRFLPFIETFCDALYSDVNNALLKRKRRGVSTVAPQVHTLFLLLNVIDIGMHKYKVTPTTDSKAADLLRVHLMQPVFRYLSEKQTRYGDQMTAVFIKYKVIATTLIPLSELSVEELKSSLLWKDLLELLVDVIEVDAVPLIERMEKFWLLLFTLTSEPLTPEHHHVITTCLNAVFNKIFYHRTAVEAFKLYYIGLDLYMQRAEQLDISFNISRLADMKQNMKQAVQLLAATQITDFFEMLLKNIQERMNLEDVLQRPNILELLLFPLITFSVNVSINDSNFRYLKELAVRTGQGITAPLLDYAFGQLDEMNNEYMVHEIIKHHYAMTVLIKRTTEFSSDVYTYQPVLVDENDAEDYFIDFRKDPSTMETEEDETQYPFDGYKISNVGGTTLSDLLTKLSFSTRAIICYLLSQRISLFYQQMAIVKSNNLHITGQSQKDNHIIRFLERNLSSYFKFLRNELVKNISTSAKSNATWSGEVEDVNSAETYTIMLWFIITANFTQFIQFLNKEDLRTVLDFMIDQTSQDEPVNTSQLTLHNLSTKLWTNYMEEWVDSAKSRELLFSIFVDRLKADIQAVQKDKYVKRLFSSIESENLNYDAKAEVDKLAKKQIKVIASEVPSYYARLILQKGLKKLFKKSKSKGYKKSSILQSDSNKKLQNSSLALNYIPLLLHLPRDYKQTFFSEAENFKLLSLLVTLNQVLHLNKMKTSISIPNLISSYLDVSSDRVIKATYFSTQAFTSQLQTFNNTKTDELVLQAQMLTSYLRSQLPDNESSDILVKLIHKFEKDSQEQGENRLIVISTIFQHVIEALQQHTPVHKQLGKNVHIGLFHNSTALIDFELHWLRAIRQSQASDELELTDIQALHISQILLIMMQLGTLYVQHLLNLNPEIWGLFIYLCKTHMNHLLARGSNSKTLSIHDQQFVTNFAKASFQYANLSNERVMHMARELITLQPFIWSSILQLVKQQPDAKVILTECASNTNLSNATEMIQYVHNKLPFVLYTTKNYDEACAEISAYIASISALLTNEQVKMVHCDTVLQVLGNSILTFRHVPRTNQDWFLNLITLCRQLVIDRLKELDFPKLVSLFTNAVTILKAYSDDAENQISSLPNNNWMIFNEICNMLLALTGQYNVFKYGGENYVFIYRTLLSIILDQNFVYSVTNEEDFPAYLQLVQTCNDKLKKLYTGMVSRKLSSDRFIEQVVYDVIRVVIQSHVTLSTNIKNTRLKIRQSVIAALVDDESKSDPEYPIPTFTQFFPLPFAPNVKENVPARLQDAQAKDLFAFICSKQKTDSGGKLH